MKLEEIVSWYQRKRTPQVSAGRAQELYFQFHPRTAFLKLLPLGASVVDIGAGDGSLSTFREWPEPARKDLRLHAYSIEKGERFDAFESYEISDWNLSRPEFGGLQFDAIVSAHFIEHIEDPLSFIAWAARKLKPGGMAYVEWPSEYALSLPGKQALAAAGVDLVISRFDDDKTHRDLPARQAVKDGIAAAKLGIVGEGLVRMPWIEHEFMAHFRDAADRFPAQAAFWSWTAWSQYLVFEKPLQPSESRL